MNSTLTLTLTRRADKIFRGDQDSVRFILQRSFHVCRMTCVTHAYIVSCFVKGMTVAVNQQIPLDTSRGEPGALYTSGLPSLHTLYGLLLVSIESGGVSACVCLWESGEAWGVSDGALEGYVSASLNGNTRFHKGCEPLPQTTHVKTPTQGSSPRRVGAGETERQQTVSEWEKRQEDLTTQTWLLMVYRLQNDMEVKKKKKTLKIWLT